MNDELIRLSADEQAQLIRTKQISASELLDTILSHAVETNEKTHAIVTFCGKEAREKAEMIDRKLAKGEDPGPLAGVPYSAKDVFCTRGIRTTGGSRILEKWIPP